MTSFVIFVCKELHKFGESTANNVALMSFSFDLRLHKIKYLVVPVVANIYMEYFEDMALGPELPLKRVEKVRG